MKSRLYLVCLVCVLAFSACWKDVWVNIDIENPVLEINTMLVPDSVIKLRLDATSYLNGMSFRELNQQSDVRLWVNDEFKESLRLEHDAEWEYSILYLTTICGKPTVYDWKLVVKDIRMPGWRQKCLRWFRLIRLLQFCTMIR